MRGRRKSEMEKRQFVESVWEMNQTARKASPNPIRVVMEGSPRVKIPKTTGMSAANKAETGAAIVIWPSARARYKKMSPARPTRLASAPIKRSLFGGIGSRRMMARIMKGTKPAISAR